jgi:hypothetical protein
MLEPYGRLKVTWRYTPFNLACNHHFTASLFVFSFYLELSELYSKRSSTAWQSWNDVRLEVQIRSGRFKEEIMQA